MGQFLERDEAAKAAKGGKSMISILEELIGRMFGARDQIAIPVRADEGDQHPQDKQLKGRK